MSYIEKKPINRSKLRLFLGQTYYRIRKYFYWWLSKNKYSENINKEELGYVIFMHSTPIYRKLRNVDMYLQLIGKPTYRKGYKDGVVLCPNGDFKPGVGGGLCQLSNLIYWITLHTPLAVTERYRHSHDVFPDVNRTQPFGSGATCFFNYLDLEIKNTTNKPYQLKLYLTNEKLVGEWRSIEKCNYRYEIYEKEHSIAPGFYGHYIRNNVIHRKVFNIVGEEINDEYVAENHAFMMYQPYLDNGKVTIDN